MSQGVENRGSLISVPLALREVHSFPLETPICHIAPISRIYLEEIKGRDSRRHRLAPTRSEPLPTDLIWTRVGIITANNPRHPPKKGLVHMWPTIGDQDDQTTRSLTHWSEPGEYRILFLGSMLVISSQDSPDLGTENSHKRVP